MKLGVGYGRPIAIAWALADLVLGFPQHGATASRAAELGPPAPLAEPAGGYVGRIKVSPAHGPVGTSVTVTGEGFAAGQEFDLVWGTVTGSWKVSNAEYFGREYVPAAYRIATSDAAGRIGTTFTAPDDFGFMHDIILQQGKRLLTKDAFSVDMTVKLLADNVPVGTPIPIEVQGIGWRELEGSWVMLYDNRFTGWISTVTTGGTARFAVSAAGQPGRHVIEVVHSDFTFPYRNMQQSPAPNRPQFKIGFTIVPGGAVLPSQPPQQAQAQVHRLPPQGELVATPAFSGVDQPVVVKGSGFAPGKIVALNWTTVTGNRISSSGQVSSVQSRMTSGSGDRPVGAGGWEERSRVVAEAKADAAGSVEFRFTAPDDLGGSHGLWADTGTGSRQIGTFWIAPTALPLDVSRGPVETTFKIHLKGVGWSESANIYTVVYDNGHSGYACGFNSQGDVEIFMQATGEPGWHFIDLYPAIYKGRETRPVNYRLPQLTAEQDHPGEDLPVFHFAFEVTPPGTRVSGSE